MWTQVFLKDLLTISTIHWVRSHRTVTPNWYQTLWKSGFPCKDSMALPWRIFHLCHQQKFAWNSFTFQWSFHNLSDSMTFPCLILFSSYYFLSWCGIPIYCFLYMYVNQYYLLIYLFYSSIYVIHFSIAFPFISWPQERFQISAHLRYSYLHSLCRVHGHS